MDYLDEPNILIQLNNNYCNNFLRFIIILLTSVVVIWTVFIILGFI